MSMKLINLDAYFFSMMTCLIEWEGEGCVCVCFIIFSSDRKDDRYSLLGPLTSIFLSDIVYLVIICHFILLFGIEIHL